MPEWAALVAPKFRLALTHKKPFESRPKGFLQLQENYPKVAKAALKVALGRKAADANFSSKR